MFLTPSLLGDLLVLFILGLIVSHSYSLWIRGRWMAFDPLNAFWAGVFICYVHEPISYGADFIPWHEPGVFDKTLFWIAFGLVWVVVGYESRVGQRLGVALPRPPARMIPNRLALAGIVFVGLGLLGYYYTISVSGGWEQWISVARGGTAYEKVSGYVTILTTMVPVGVGLLLFHAELHRVSPPKRIILWSLGILTLLWFIYLGTRSRTITFLATMLAAWYLPRRKNPSLILLAPVFVGLMILTTFQAEYRDKFTNLSLNLDAIDREEAKAVTLPKWLGGKGKEARGKEISKGAEFNCVMTAVELVPNPVPYSYGYGFLECFTRLVPKAFWPEKRYPHLESKQALFRLGELTDFVPIRGQANLVAGPAFTFAGTWYHVGGGIGLLVGGLFTGMLLRTFRTFLERAPDSEGVILIYPQLLMVGFFEAAFEPFEWTIRLPIGLLPLLILLYVCRASPQRTQLHQGIERRRIPRQRRNSTLHEAPNLRR